MLLALDPSVNSAGVALFDSAGLLYAADTIKAPRGSSKWPMVRRCAWIAREVVAWQRIIPIRAVVTEWPQTYTPGRSKGDPSDLHPMAGVATAVAALLPDAESFCYLPRQWVGGTKKEKGRDIFKTSRAVRIHSRLSADELEVWSAQVKTHDAIDAVGIGLHHLGRLKPRRVISRE